jgi:hypothetical protein
MNNKKNDMVVRRRKLSNDEKNIIRFNYNYKCAICKNILPPAHDFDHKIPLHKFNKTTQKRHGKKTLYEMANNICNFQPLCLSCHGEKTQHERINMNMLAMIRRSRFQESTCPRCGRVHSKHFVSECERVIENRRSFKDDDDNDDDDNDDDDDNKFNRSMHKVMKNKVNFKHKGMRLRNGTIKEKIKTKFKKTHGDKVDVSHAWLLNRHFHTWKKHRTIDVNILVRTKRSNLYSDFEGWCSRMRKSPRNQNETHCMNAHDFYARLRKCGYIEKRRGSTWFLYGLNLINDQKHSFNL